jgi:DNA-binding NarL/FixJ family response regulator
MAIIGGSRLLRDSAAGLFDADEELRVVGSHASVADFLETGAAVAPDVILLDCNGGGPESWERAITALRDPYPHCKILMLCAEARDDVIGCAIELRVGGVVLSTPPLRSATRSSTWQREEPSCPPAGSRCSRTHGRSR